MEAVSFNSMRILAAVWLAGVLSPALGAASGPSRASLSRLPLQFQENRGQADGRIDFTLQAAGMTVGFHRGGVTFILAGRAAEPSSAARWVLKQDLVGAEEARPSGGEPSETVVSFFTGPRDAWRTGVPVFRSLIYEDLWPGIDLVYSGEGGRLKATYHVKPGADPSRIRVDWSGGEEMGITSEGRLRVATPLGTIEEDRPVSWQGEGSRRSFVRTAYELVSSSDPCRLEVGFRVEGYDPSRELVLDPVILSYCGFIGGSGSDIGMGIAVDSSNYAYVTGYTASTAGSFPDATGPDTSHNGGTNDAFVAKVDTDGDSLIWCGYIGGSGEDYGRAIAVDSSGNAYVTGDTTSTAGSFPDTGGPDTSHNSGVDAWVAKVAAAGTSLTYCGYIGGSGDDYGRGIAVDSSGNAFVVGDTTSTAGSFPDTGGPDTSHNGGIDAFIAKVASDGTSLTYCGYIGGSSDDVGTAVALDSSGIAHVTGYASSTESSFPDATGPDTSHNGGKDAFVAKVASAGTSLTWCGYIGGSSDDEGWGIAVDSSGNVYVTGYAASTQSSFPDTGGPDLTHNGGKDAFVAKVVSAGTSLTYSGFIGGANDDYGWGIAVDSSGNVSIAGQTASNQDSFPVSTGPDWSHNGGVDAFVIELSSTGTTVLHCGYIGGSGDDYARAVAIDTAGGHYVTGDTASTESTFPVTTGPDTTHNSGTQDAFVAKVASTEEGGIYVASASSAVSSSTTTSLSWTTHTIGEGTDRILLVGVVVRNDASQTVSSVTWEGTNLTRVTNGFATNGTNVRVEMWYLLDPDVGINGTIAINLSASAMVLAGAVALTGIHQTTPFDTFATATGNSTTPSVAASSATGDVVVDIMGATDTPTATVGSGQDELFTAVTTGSNNVRGSMSSESGASSVTMSYTLSGTEQWAIGAVSLNPSNTTAVQLVSIGARPVEEGVAVEWRTGREVDNLGFHVWREAGGASVRLDSSLLAGTALLAGSGTEVTAGHSYRFLDAEGTPGAAYWLEAVDLQGRSTWHGPAAEPAKDIRPGPRRGAAFAGEGSAIPDAAPPAARAVPLARLGRSRRARPSRATIPSLPARPGITPPAPSSTEASSAVQWALAAGPSLKILVESEGWHRLGRAELIERGLDPTAGPRDLRLFTEGREAPIAFQGPWRPLREGLPAPEDALEFHGVERDPPSAGPRVYWLAPGHRPGKRIALTRARRPLPEGPESFPFTLLHEEDVIYFAALRNGDGDNFFGPVVAGEPVEVDLEVRDFHAAAREEAVIEARLLGVTGTRHRVRVEVNGAEAGIVELEGQAAGGAALALPAGLLREGTNGVTLTALGGEADVTLLDSIRLTYPRSFIAEGDALRFLARGGRSVTVRGFRDLTIRAVDVTDPHAPVLLRGEVIPDGKRHALRVAVSGRGERVVQAFSSAGARRPAAVELDRPSRWSRAGQAGDLVIITHRSLEDALPPLRAAREAEGWRVAVIDVQDLYDEFSHGHHDPRAIRRFLARAAARWSLPPRAAILFGDASFDPLGLLGLGEHDLVPTGMAQSTHLETASDDWLSDFDDDGIPEIPLGRIPVRTREEAEAVVAKLAGYASAGGEWTRQVLLVADSPDLFDFRARSRELLESIPEALEVREVLLDEGRPGMREELAAALHAGSLVVNYLGHGSVESWSRGGLFTTEDALAATNGPRLPLVISMNCLNGFFHDVHTECLAEALLKAPAGGAIAVWASSALTSPAGQAVLNREALRLLLDGTGRTVGEALREAKRAVEDRDVRRTWILFGDPTLRLAAPGR